MSAPPTLIRRDLPTAVECFSQGRDITRGLSSRLPSTGIFRILICRTSHSLGNTLLVTPLIRELERIFPGAEMDIVTRTSIGGDIFGRFTAVRRVITIPAHAFRHPALFLSALRSIVQVPYDLVIDPCPRSRTGRSLVAHARGAYKLGFSGYIDRALTHSVPLPSDIPHTGKRAVYLIRAALGATESEYPMLDIGLSAEERRDGRATLSRLLEPTAVGKGRGVIGIFANATGAKLLPRAWWQRFLNALSARYSAHRIVEVVPAFGRSMLGSSYPTFFSSDIRRLAGMLSALTAFVSADCGVMHLACASGIPVTGVFNTTDPGEWGPYGPRDSTIDARGLSPEQVAEQVVVFH